MVFYIASGLENFENVREAANILKSLGHEHAYDWTSHGDVRDQGEETLRKVAFAEAQAVIKSDLVLILMPGFRGTHTELGIAIASCEYMSGKQIWIWSESGEDFAFDSRTCVFYFHPNVRRFVGDFKYVVAALRQWSNE